MSMPSVFVSHGSPTLILENLPARDFLSTLGSLLPRPKAIVAVSAHWNTERPAVSTAERPETIHDFYGFPDDLYRLHYEAPGAPELAERVAKMTGAVCDPSYGLDHGAWVPAMLGWPEADIPIFQLAVQPYMTPTHHIALGRKLAPLRDEGILVMGSGSATHNLRRLVRGQHGAKPEPWLWQAVAGRHRAKVENVVHIGDQLIPDVYGALWAGSRVVHVRDAADATVYPEGSQERVLTACDLPTAVQVVRSWAGG